MIFLHPLIRGLVRQLPPPGTNWPEEKRKQWVETMVHVFRVLYRDKLPDPKPKALDPEPVIPDHALPKLELYERRLKEGR